MRKITWKKLAKKAKNPILITICILAVIAMIFGAGYVQQELYKKGVILFSIGYVWMLLFLKANPDLCWTEECCKRCENRHCENYYYED